jgi:hypothetical protein
MTSVSKLGLLSLAFVLPAIAATPFPGLSLTPSALVSFEASTEPDRAGRHTFSASAGDIVVLTLETPPGERQACYPEMVDGGRFSPVGSTIRPTPHSESLVLEIEESGDFQYQLMPLRRFSLGDTGSAPMDQPLADPASHGCKVTAQLGSETEKNWAIANRLSEDYSGPDQALELYRQVLATQPDSPEPYENYTGLLISLSFRDQPTVDARDPEAVGQMFLSLPDDVRSDLIGGLQRLAGLYEANPDWESRWNINQVDAPTLLREYASYVETGVASDLMKSVMFSQ